VWWPTTDLRAGANISTAFTITRETNHYPRDAEKALAIGQDRVTLADTKRREEACADAARLDSQRQLAEGALNRGARDCMPAGLAAAGDAHIAAGGPPSVDEAIRRATALSQSLGGVSGSHWRALKPKGYTLGPVDEREVKPIIFNGGDPRQR
jgi:hypothetical protein